MRRKMSEADLAQLIQDRADGALPSPESEAHALVLLVGRGPRSSPDDLRELIRVTPAQAEFLRRITRGNPVRAHLVERMIEFRRDVLRHFERELASKGNVQ